MEAKDIPGSVEALTAQLEANARQISDLLRQVAELERQLDLQADLHSVSLRARDARILRCETMLDWLADNAGIDAFVCVRDKDRHDYALDAATEAGREEPNQEDEREGFRRLVRAAMEGER